MSRVAAEVRRLQPIVAIDGPAGAGKTSTAREVARQLGFTYLDTGAMYRAIALAVLRAQVRLDDPVVIANVAQRTELEIRFSAGQQRVFLAGEDVSEEIRSPEVTQAVTPVCEVPAVRQSLVAWQRELGAAGGFVVEGRDIGTVVFPDAVLKIYLDASPTVRAERRFRELATTQAQADKQQLTAEMEARDRRDRERDNSPLQKAPDAILIDTSTLSFEQQVAEIVRLYQQL